ncbi:TRAP transporter large permease [uncultured Sphaerochaeta sp.]|uniref:TRAP transporter large permease n=1 Tax=uncultured Sphaerochaeta sp. TaxID=886478 RepID=UPI003748F1B8
MLAILLVVFVVLLVIGTPLAFTFCAASFISVFFAKGFSPLLLIQKLFGAMDSFTYMAIPLFLLAGNIMNEAGITKKLVALADSLVGQFHGGLAQTTALSGMLMAGISGSANADASAIGALMLPPLREAGYDEGFRVSLVSSCAVLGPIIPPSILMIVYSGVTSISIGQLFLAGVVPGVGLGLMYMFYSFLYAKKNHIPTTAFRGWSYVGKSLWGALGGLMMPLIIIGGILLGVVTATEAGVLAVMYGLAYGFITKSLSMEKLKEGVLSSMKATVASVLVISFASLLGFIFTHENLPALLVRAMSGLTANKYFILGLMSAVLVLMGLFIDSNAILLMMVPVFSPFIVQFGLNPVYFAMIVLLSVATGGLTPPVGLVLYIVAGIENANISKVCRSIWMFVGLMALMIVLVIFIPQIVTWLPSVM